MNKIIFIDADGVTIVLREKFFSQRFSEKFGVEAGLVMPLFKNEYYKCVLGQMDLKEVLKSYMPKWGWKGTVEELLLYWWGAENKPNISVLEKMSQLRAQGVKFYLATDQEKYRANYIMQDMGLEKYLDGAFFSCDLGLSKSTKEYWQKVLEILNVQNLAEVEYWDDEEENISAAKEVGIRAHLYRNPEDLNIKI
jgi:putative hydrolase of the HAD superfamily